MAGILGRLLGGRPLLPARVTGVLKELEQLARDRPGLQASCGVLEEVLPALFCEAPQETPPTLSADAARQKIAGAIPLLRGESITLDDKSFSRRWHTICAGLERQQHSGVGKSLVKVLPSLDLAQIIQELLAGRPEAVYGRALACQIDPSLFASVLRLSLFPVLSRLAAFFAPVLQEHPWDHGYCPVCGSWPLLGEYRGLEQARFLRCGLCACAWEFPRLCCPFCGERDHRLLGYFHADGEATRFRAATCDACHGYVKMVSTLTPLTDAQLFLMELATLHLDLVAGERGFFVA